VIPIIESPLLLPHVRCPLKRNKKLQYEPHQRQAYKPEMLVRKFLHANGFRYKLHDKSLPGKPDIVLPKYKTVIFVHGCFWYGHKNCKYFVGPKTTFMK